MSKKIILTESQLTRLVQYRAKTKLNESKEIKDENVDEIEIDVDEEYSEETPKEEKESLNEGQLELKNIFNKYMKSPIINGLSSLKK